MGIRRHSRRSKSLLAAGLATALTGVFAASVPSASATTEKVAIYFAVCDGNTDTDTVKIKKIYEDGTGITTIGDTTIDHCSGSENDSRYLSGLAVSGEYAYFSWINSSFNGAGIGRMKTDGSTPAQVDYVSGPAGAGWFQMSPKALNGDLYVYVHDGGQSPSNLRIMRLSTTTGALSNCYTPTGSPNAMSIGVGKDAVYYSVATSNLGDDQKLMKVSSDCSTATEYLDINNFPGSANVHSLFTSSLATVISESDTNMFLYTKHNVNDTYGLSQVDTGASPSNFQEHVYKADDGYADSQVWGFNYLYYKDGGASKMYRVAPGGTPEQVFADHIKGILHHMSVVKETPATAPTTPAPETKAPLLISKKGVTGKQVAKDLGIKVRKGSKIRLAVAKKSSKVCALNKNKTRVVRLKKGKKCRVTITITPKKGKTIKRTTSFTTS